MGLKEKPYFRKARGLARIIHRGDRGERGAKQEKRISQRWKTRRSKRTLSFRPSLSLSSLSALRALRGECRGSVTIIACGERWETPDEDGPLRVAVGDYLAAGAILASLTHDKSPEAQVCEGAFRHARDRIEEIVWDCASGRELRARGYGEDVRHGARLDLYDVVPVMRGGWLQPAGQE